MFDLLDISLSEFLQNSYNISPLIEPFHPIYLPLWSFMDINKIILYNL